VARRAGQFAESRGEIRFPEISTNILEKVIQYFYYKVKYTNSTVRIPEFQIEPDIALELLMAANFLDV
jgi:transcription elongation factor B subunit 1